MQVRASTRGGFGGETLLLSSPNKVHDRLAFDFSVHALEHMPVFEEVIVQLLSTALEGKVLLKTVTVSIRNF